jgi:hypothetical protein
LRTQEILLIDPELTQKERPSKRIKKGKENKPPPWMRNENSYYRGLYGKPEVLYAHNLQEGFTMVQSNHWKLVLPLSEFRFFYGDPLQSEYFFAEEVNESDQSYDYKIQRQYQPALYSNYWTITKTRKIKVIIQS